MTGGAGPFAAEDTPTQRALAAVQEAAQPAGATTFALLDGGLFPDLRAWLDHTGLIARPLFREGDDPAAALAGPWLVPLDRPAQEDALVAMMGNVRAPVMLCWHGTTPDLYEHLRRQTLIEVPDDRLADVDGRTPHETVLFRFWDPAVLAAAWVVFHPDQQRRLFPGRTIALVDAWGRGDWQWLVPDARPAPPGRPRQFPHLRLDEAQAEAMERDLKAPHLEAMTEDVGALMAHAGLAVPPGPRRRAAVEDADWMAGELDLVRQDSVVALAFHILAFGRHGRETRALVAAVGDPEAAGRPDDRLLAHMAAVADGAGG